MLGDSLWAIVVVLGFAILAGALLFAKVKNKRSPEAERRTEQATREGRLLDRVITHELKQPSEVGKKWQ